MVVVQPLFPLLLFAAALWALQRLLADYDLHEVVSAVSAVRPGALLLSLATTALGYLALVGYDYVAFRFIERPLPLRAMLVPSFVSFAVANSAPASVLTGGGVRYRVYARHGLTVKQAAAVAGFDVVTYVVGLLALSGIALVAGPGASEAAPAWAAVSGRTLGVVLLVVVVAYFVVAVAWRRPLRLFGRDLRMPSPQLALAQLAVSAADWILSSGALYVLLADVGRLPYLAFLTRFLVAAVVSLVVPIPGGLGVFEAVVLYLTSSGTPAPRVLAALLVYRVVYYLLPLVAAGALLLAAAVRRAGRGGVRPGRWIVDQLLHAAPRLVSLTTFLSGWLLLVTGTLATDERRLAWLSHVLPLALVEASHFLASVLGAAMLIVAWGLERRARSAYHLAVALYGLGIVASLLRAADVRLAAGLLAALLVLVVAERKFPHRQPGDLLREPFAAGWVVGIGAAFVVTLSVGMFEYHGVRYSSQLWWRVALDDRVPRALRAAVGASVTFLLFALARVLARHAPRPIARSSRSEA